MGGRGRRETIREEVEERKRKKERRGVDDEGYAGLEMARFVSFTHFLLLLLLLFTQHFLSKVQQLTAM